MGPTQTDIGQGQADIGQGQTDIGQGQTDIGQGQMEIDPKSNMGGILVSNLVQFWSTFWSKLRVSVCLCCFFLCFCCVLKI